MQSENTTGPAAAGPTIASGEIATTKARDFWHGQDRILDCMQAFTMGWFERRHAGTRAALEAAKRICAARTPIDAAREYQDWASGSLQRVATDSVALQRELMDIGDALISASSHSYDPRPST